MIDDESEAIDDITFIERSYARTLGRAVDPRGLRDGLERLAQGQSRREFAAVLQASDEAQARLERIDAGARNAAPCTLLQLLAIEPTTRFVDGSHRLLAGRPATTSEIAAAYAALRQGTSRIEWLRGLRRATVSTHSALADVERLDLSNEEWAGRVSGDLSHLLRATDEAFVHLAYWRMLGRGPDATGRRTYLRRLWMGERRVDLLQELRSSPEGLAHGATLPGLVPERTHTRLRQALRGVKRLVRHFWFDPSTPAGQPPRQARALQPRGPSKEPR